VGLQLVEPELARPDPFDEVGDLLAHTSARGGGRKAVSVARPERFCPSPPARVT
jgi:hypothetical protein